MFIKYKSEVENQKNKRIKRLRTDRGGEYESNPFKELFSPVDKIVCPNMDTNKSIYYHICIKRYKCESPFENSLIS